MQGKTCTLCGETKQPDEFHNDAGRPDGKFPQCKPCRRGYALAYQERQNEVNRAAYARLDDEAKKARAERSRAQRYRSKYDLTIEEYEALLEYQAGVCAICGKYPGKTRLHVDHDHTTGFVRGLACFTCNSLVLGRNRNEGLLRNAADYLRDPPAPRALGRQPVGVQGSTNKRTRRRRKK